MTHWINGATAMVLAVMWALSPAVAIAGAVDTELRGLIERHELEKDPREGHDIPGPDDPSVVLGKELFFSTLLGGDGDVSCASCHHPALGGADGLSLSVGVGAEDVGLLGPGRRHDGNREVDPNADGGPNVPRNAPTTFNTAFYEGSLFWDGRVHALVVGERIDATIRTPESRFNSPDPRAGESLLAAQARFPVTSPVEMLGFGSLNRLSGDDIRATLATRFAEQFDLAEGERLSFDRVAETLGAYQRSQVFIDSPWSRYVAGADDALSATAKRGAVRFLTSMKDGGAGCVQCHAGARFTDEEFYNLAVPQFGRGKDTRGHDVGRALVTGRPEDRYRFRTPGLLNVAVTAPYGHSGAFPDLADSVRHHLDVETSLADFDYGLGHLRQFDGVEVDVEQNRRASRAAYDAMVATGAREALPRGPVDEVAVTELVAFLESLTDPCVRSAECLRPWLPAGDKGEQGPDGSVRMVVADLPADVPVVAGEPADARPRDAVKTASDRTGGAPASDLRFANVTADAGLSYDLVPSGHDDEWHMVGGGVAVADYDRDGWLDLFVTHGKNGPGRLFRSRGDGTFEDRTRALGEEDRATIHERGGLFLDIDEDGHLDLIVIDDTEQPIRVLRNRGDGRFENITSSTGLETDKQTYSVAAADYDVDGDLDLFFAHWGVTMLESAALEGYLWRNEGGGKFVDMTRLTPLRLSTFAGQPILFEVVFTPNFSDIDRDGFPDLLLASDFRASQVLRNRRGVQFVDATDWVISDENGMGAAVGDYDGDGDMDWFVSSIWNPVDSKPYNGGESGNRLYRNDGSGNFSDATDEAGVRQGYWGWGACFADFDNDGDLDLLHVNGMGNNDAQVNLKHEAFLHDPARLYVSSGDGTFVEASQEAGIDHEGQGRGVTCFDYDRDGDLDVLVSNNGRAPSLYRNDTEPRNHWLRVRLEGAPGNSEGVGAWVEAHVAGRTQTREIRLGSNYLSNDPVVAHFGLGPATRVERLEVRWPDGRVDEHRNVEVDREILLRPSGD